jgi:hypothetical protein
MTTLDFQNLVAQKYCRTVTLSGNEIGFSVRHNPFLAHGFIFCHFYNHVLAIHDDFEDRSGAR